ncbi:MAG: hypothetical protein WBN68_20425 [Sedimenticolaceae bacterium]
MSQLQIIGIPGHEGKGMDEKTSQEHAIQVGACGAWKTGPTTTLALSLG